MRVPKPVWWVLAPLSWPVQYLIYEPAFGVWHAFAIRAGLFGGWPRDPQPLMVEPAPRFRPWFIERLR